MGFSIQKHWYSKSLSWLTALLLPFSWLFRLIVSCRALLYRLGVFSVYRSPLPVVVVGNLTVGGTGKTPLVAHLVEELRSKGLKPAIVMRGYAGKNRAAHEVSANSQAFEVGDEAVVLFERLGCPVVIGKKRVSAIKYVENNCDCDVIISDDGLQHYAMARDVEILVLDGMRRLGNQQLLPAGPLREPVKRLANVDFVVTNGEPQPGEFGMHIEPLQLVSLRNDSRTLPVNAFAGKAIHALAGIGNPDRFFETMTLLGCDVCRHPYPDHHFFSEQDITFDGDIVMTEKDAVKCRFFAKDNHWFLRIGARVDDSLLQAVLLLINGREK